MRAGEWYRRDHAQFRGPCSRIRRRRFETPAGGATVNTDEREFRIRLALTGEVFTVPADKSIVEVLRENGIDIETCCEQGYCGTCMTRYLEGEPEHRDTVLDDEDREDYVMVCCARSRTEELVLDL